jgi:hypothetical protein
MKAAVLYLLAAATTAVHVSYLASQAILGAAGNPLHDVSFAGSVGLAFAALMAPFRARRAAIIALGGSLACWCFYIPALVISFLVQRPLSSPEVRFLFANREYVALLGPFVCPLLLLGTMVYAIRLMKRSAVS